MQHEKSLHVRHHVGKGFEHKNLPQDVFSVLGHRSIGS